MAKGFPRWDLRFRQLGSGPLRGQLQLLELGGTQVFRVAVNRMVHAEGWRPGGFGYAPILAANARAIWRGRRLNAGQVRVGIPGQQVDHVTAGDQYHMVGMEVDGNLYRQ